MKLIQIDSEHYIIVDDSEIKEGDWHLKNDKLITRSYIIDENCKKIAHSTEPLEDYTRADGKKIKVYVGINPLNLFEVKELIGEVDVEQKACKYNPVNKLDAEFIRAAYIEGYNQSLEDNKDKKYTEEDVIRIVEKSRETGLTAEYLLLSLQPKTEWEVEFVDGKLKLK